MQVLHSTAFSSALSFAVNRDVRDEIMKKHNKLSLNCKCDDCRRKALIRNEQTRNQPPDRNYDQTQQQSEVRKNPLTSDKNNVIDVSSDDESDDEEDKKKRHLEATKRALNEAGRRLEQRARLMEKKLPGNKPLHQVKPNNQPMSQQRLTSFFGPSNRKPKDDNSRKSAISAVQLRSGLKFALNSANLGPASQFVDDLKNRDNRTGSQPTTSRDLPSTRLYGTRIVYNSNRSPILEVSSNVGTSQSTTRPQHQAKRKISSDDDEVVMVISPLEPTPKRTKSKRTIRSSSSDDDVVVTNISPLRPTPNRTNRRHSLKDSRQPSTSAAGAAHSKLKRKRSLSKQSVGGKNSVEGRQRKKRKPRPKKPTTTKFKRQKGVKPEDQTSQTNFTSVKLKLASVVRGNNNPIKQTISAMSIKATKIAALASLLLLVKVNTNINDQNFFSLKAESVVEDCFFEVLKLHKTQSGKRRIPKFPQYRSQWFAAELWNQRIQRPNNDQMGNMFRYLHQQYATNFKTNICTHGYRRISNFLRTIPGSTKKQRRNTMAFLFNSNSKCEPDRTHIDGLRNLPHHTITDWHRGVLENIESDWFGFVPLFVAIQRHVYAYNMAHADEWRQEDEQVKADRKKKKIKRKYPRMRPMKIVPLCKYRRQHIRIDSEALYHLFAVQKILPKQRDKIGRDIDRKQFIEREDEFWATAFDMDKIMEICTKTPNKIAFHHQIHTDGMSVSLIYSAPPKPEIDVDKKLKRIRNNVNNNQYHYHTAIDVGYNTYIAAVRKTVSSKKEVNRTLKAKQFHRSTGNNLRKKIFKRLASDFESRAALHREQYPEIPSPTGPQYLQYVQHCLKFLEEGLAVYTTPQYARLAFDKYSNTQKRIDKIVTELTNRKSTLLFIGGAEFQPNSPIKGHVRCPSIRKVTRAMYRHKSSDFVFVDEYNTSQHCGLCCTKFDKSTKAYRFKRCFGCASVEPVVPKAPVIITKQSKRNRQQSRLSGEEHNRNKSVRFVAADMDRRKSTTWHRDITACRLIGYKGLNGLMEQPITDCLQRRVDSIEEYSNSAFVPPIVW